MKIKEKEYSILNLKTKGMQCTNCERVIQKVAMSVNGVKSAKANYAKEETTIEYDRDLTNEEKIIEAISKEGYECRIIKKEAEKEEKKIGIEDKELEEKVSKEPEEEGYRITLPRFSKHVVIAGSILFLLGLYWLIKQSFNFNLPEIAPEMGLLLIFIVGILTSFHCVGMCGGFILSYTTKEVMDKEQTRKSRLISHIKYGAGKTITYTILGALFGLLGSFIAFTPTLKGFAALIAGIFLIIYGLNMINVFPWLRKLRFRGPKFMANADTVKTTKSPFYIGLANGLMIACGPLQAMLIYAAGTGNLFQGALAMFVFGLGTLSLMLSFGSIATILGSKFTHKMLKISAVVVIVLGMIMINRGLILIGSGYDFKSLISPAGASGSDVTGTVVGLNSANQLNDGYQEIRMDVTRYGWEPNKFVLKRGIPVKWIINGKEITGCNKEIQVPKLGLRFDVKVGEQVIEFTPDKEGIIPFSCWMGMIQGQFIVKEDINISNKEQLQKELAKAPIQQGGTCGVGGGCGCGGSRIV